METNYIVLLDYSIGEIIRIRLNAEQRAEADSYDNFEEYLSTLEEQYQFRLKDCVWMVCEILSERSFG